MSTAVVPQRQYERVAIYPYVQFVPPNPIRRIDNRLEPVRFAWLGKSGINVITVDDPGERARCAALKAGGHGYCYTCRVSWLVNGETKTKLSEVWYDPRRLEWFTEVDKRYLPDNWQSLYTELGQDRGKKKRLRASLATTQDGPVVQKPIYPMTKFVPREVHTGQDLKLLPVQYDWETDAGIRRIQVEDIITVMRAPELKASGQGLRYSCYVSWEEAEGRLLKHSYLWFSPLQQEWYTDVPV